MSFGYKQVKDAIVAILSDVASVAVVYGKEEKSLGQFPAVCISGRGHKNTYKDLGGNLRTVQHTIRLYFPVDDQNSPDYEDVLEATADDVIVALEHDVTLGGACDYTIPTEGSWSDGEKQVPVRFLEITLESRARVLR